MVRLRGSEGLLNCSWRFSYTPKDAALGRCAEIASTKCSLSQIKNDVKKIITYNKERQQERSGCVSAGIAKSRKRTPKQRKKRAPTSALLQKQRKRKDRKSVV